MQQGISINAFDNQGKTALNYARSREVYDALRHEGAEFQIDSFVYMNRYQLASVTAIIVGLALTAIFADDLIKPFFEGNKQADGVDDQIKLDNQDDQVKKDDKPVDKVESPIKKVSKTGDEFRNYDSTLSIPQNIALELQTARQDAVQNISLQKYEYEPIDIETQDILMTKKDMLCNMRKSCVMKGTMRSPSVSLSGCLDVGNIVALEKATFSSKGLIENSLSKEVSFMHGDFIVTKSTFYGKSHIEQEASVLSYDSCLLDELCVHKKDVIIELRDTIVTGNIIFDHPGIIVIDDKTILGGTISNARVMMIRN